MSDALEQVLRLVAEGRLSASEAEPILDALGETTEERPRPAGAPWDGTEGRTVRILVTEGGRRILNLRVPLALGRFAWSRIPGLSDPMSERIRRAIDSGMTGTILESADPSGDGVRIFIE